MSADQAARLSRPTGVFTALATPMHPDGSIDEPRLRQLVDRQVAAGVAGVVPCGTTGETPTLTHAEQRRVFDVVVEAAAGRVPVIGGAGSNSTDTACELTHEAEQAGCQAVLQVAPYYNKPTQEGLYAHFMAVADSTSLPIILYNIPGRSAVRIEVETLARLAAHPLIVAVKEATGDLGFACRIREAVPELLLLSGDDALTLPLMAIGATGVISVASNIVPAAMVDLVASILASDLELARARADRLLPLFRTLFRESNPIPLKAAMDILGHGGPMPRLPLQPATADTYTALRAVLGELELL